MKRYLFLVIAAGCLFTVGCNRPASTPPPTLNPTQEAEQTATRESAILTMTAKAATATPSATATLEPTATRTLSPTVQASPTPNPTLATDEEEYNLLYEQAQEQGRSTACNDEGTLDCRDEVLTYPEAIVSFLQLPDYAEEVPLASPLGTIYDVGDSELERNLELAISLGLYPEEVWCGSSEHYACPGRPVNRETGPEWLQIIVLGNEVPEPCRDYFTDTQSPWVEALVCPLDVYQIRLNPFGTWRAGDPMAKGDWDVLKEQLLELEQNEEAASTPNSQSVRGGGLSKLFPFFSDYFCSVRKAAFAEALAEPTLIGKVTSLAKAAVLWTCNPACPSGWECEDATGQWCYTCYHGFAPSVDIKGPGENCPAGDIGGPNCVVQQQKGGCNPKPTDEPPPGATSTPTPTPTAVPTQAPPPPPPDDGDEPPPKPPPPPPASTGPVVIQATPIPDECYTSLEEFLEAFAWEEGKRAVAFAVRVGILEISEENPFCPWDKLWPDEMAYFVLGLPKYQDEVPLRESLGFFLDAGDPVIDLYKSLGFYPDEALRPEPKFLLCNSFLPYRHFCPKGARTQNPVDREEAFTVAWWSVVGPQEPPDTPEEFLERYPDMSRYPDSAAYVAASSQEFGYFEGIGPSRFCPRTSSLLDCDVRKVQFLVLLYRGHADG